MRLVVVWMSYRHVDLFCDVSVVVVVVVVVVEVVTVATVVICAIQYGDDGHDSQTVSPVVVVVVMLRYDKHWMMKWSSSSSWQLKIVFDSSW